MEDPFIDFYPIQEIDKKIHSDLYKSFKETGKLPEPSELIQFYERIEERKLVNFMFTKHLLV